ncbi:pyruvate kinase-like protein [Truncatella angustata]|uniref:Pyruvate kinase-like protein n=1 Tax=Truncatella angustata TaxID=152316 RepID=A0A9P8ZVG2_9PEZI|nr:pyruvate kinase-like protein [Truncatella angustata]KAH6651990.1 pyruvate kinase-like protein [Truncatella angustata]
MGSLNVGQVTSDIAAVNVAPLPPRDVLLSVRTGKIRALAGVKIRSAINKQERQGKIELTSTGLIGDEVQYEAHGGPEKALHMYSAAHYDAWNKEVPNREHLFKIGGFGENLSVRYLNEGNVCVGDIFKVGSEVLLQVSDVRQPCFKLNHRFEYKKTSSITQNSGRTGWYYRVLKTGYIREGDTFELIERTHPTWPLSRIQKYLYHDVNNAEAMKEITQLRGLGEEMVSVFTNRLVKGAEDFSGRLEGDRIPVVWQSYRLVEKNDLTPRVKRFVFEIDGSSADNESSGFGRFPHVRLQFGPDLAFSRAYSVVSGDMKRFELGIARDDKSRGGSVYLHDHVHVGDVVTAAKGHEAQTPKTDHVDNDQSMKHIFVIGGIGVTAYVRDIAMLSQTSADFQIHYAVRSRNEAAYLDLLPASKTTVYAKDEGRRLELARIIPTAKMAMIYCCGPTSLLSGCKDLTKKLRYPQNLVYFEEFGSATTGTGNPFEVEVKSTKQVLQVPQDKSLLQVLTEAGFELESSCLVGNCGTCMVDYCRGEVEHRGTALDDEMKEESMLSCVSRGKGRVLIDC